MKENYFTGWYGEGQFEGLLCRDGKFFSNFRGYGYQRSGNTEGRCDCGSCYGMQYLHIFTHLCHSRDIVKIIITGYVRSTVNSCYDMSLTNEDNKLLEEFIDKQTDYYFKESNERYSYKLKNKVFRDDNQHYLGLTEGGIIYRNKEENLKEVVITKDMLSYIDFYCHSGSVMSNALIDIICSNANMNNLYGIQEDFKSLVNYIATECYCEG